MIYIYYTALVIINKLQTSSGTYNMHAIRMLKLSCMNNIFIKLIF